MKRMYIYKNLNPAVGLIWDHKRVVEFNCIIGGGPYSYIIYFQLKNIISLWRLQFEFRTVFKNEEKEHSAIAIHH